MERFDCVVIGAGPGGYVFALRAQALGLKTALVEAKDLGGTCLNAGCVPTKALLHGSASGQDFGQAHAAKEAVVLGQRQGVTGLLEARGVVVFQDRAQVTQPGHVTLEGSGEVLEGDHIIVATGASPARPPIPGVDLPGVVTSDNLLVGQPDLPEALAIIGGGVIGVEMAALYASLGVKVTILEALPRLLATLDRELGQSLGQVFKKDGVAVVTGAMVSAITQKDGRLAVVYEAKKKEGEVLCDQVLLATGRKPATEGLFGPDAMPEMERGFIGVNDACTTSVPGLYAIGDVAAGSPQLAHFASAQAKALADRLAGRASEMDLSLVPSCVYTRPEIASVGLDAQGAKEAGVEVMTGKFLMAGNAKTAMEGLGRTFVKLIFRKEDHVIVGAQMMCGRASDLIATATVAIRAGMTAEALADTIWPHPTYAEGIGEAAEAALGLSVHQISR